jgi:hypothetical protein
MDIQRPCHDQIVPPDCIHVDWSIAKSDTVTVEVYAAYVLGE